MTYKTLSKLAVITTFVASATVFGVAKAQADTVCQSLYGGGQTCSSSNITINKTVKNPSTGQFVDNLGVNDPKFSPNNQVTFQITVGNNGTTTQGHVDVQDILPGNLTYVSFSDGNSNASLTSVNGQTITYGINNLGVNQSDTATIVAQVISNSASVCPIANQANALENGNIVAQDTATLCIQSQVLSAATPSATTVFPAPGLTQTPPTGPETVGIIGVISSIFSGVALRKRTK